MRTIAPVLLPLLLPSWALWACDRPPPAGLHPDPPGAGGGAGEDLPDGGAGGVSGSADLSIEPACVDLGMVPLGSERVATFEVESTAPGVVTAEVTTTGATFAASPRRLALASGGTTRVEVRFAPQVRGSHLAWLRVAPCAGCPPAQACVRGYGAIEEMAIEPAVVDLGLVLTGARTCAAFDVVNTGDLGLVPRAVTIDDPLTVTPGVVWLEGLDRFLHGAIAPGESARLSVCLAPPLRRPVELSGTITVVSDGSSATAELASSNGFASAVCMRREPDPVDFGPVDGESWRTSWLINCGTGSLEIATIGISTASERGFSVDPPELPAEVRPGGALALDVAFRNDAPGPHRGQVEIWLEGAELPATIDLLAEGL